ncbi:hypothetical protein WMF38_33675 [Sorangium sp. So ce118]
MAAITEPAAGAQEASEGVSLAQYAAVRAAVSEGFPLADVLAVEGLRPRAFARADLHWKQRLAAEPELLAEFEEELARAEDWLDRPIEPLADDAAAWASFLAAFGAHPAPFELLQEQRVGMNDIARLRRRWARRAEEDAELGELLAELRARPGELGPLRVGPQVLRPSRGASARGPADAPTSQPSAPAAWPRPPRGPRDVAEASPVQAPPGGNPGIPFAAAEPARPAGHPASSRRAPHAPAELGETSLSVKVPRELLGQAYARAAVTGTAPQGSMAAPSSKAGGGSRAPLAEPSEIALPLAQYAALCAELVLFPDASEAIFQRYDLGSTEMRSAVDAAWKERFSESPAEYARWQELYRRYHAHFTKRGAPAE